MRRWMRITGFALPIIALACTPGGVAPQAGTVGEPAAVVDAGVMAGTLSAADAGSIIDMPPPESALPCPPDALSPLVPGVSPESALLPGESTACSALGAVACRVSHPCVCDDFDAYYHCYDEEGHLVLSTCLEGSPCSEAQLLSWTKAFRACWRMAPASAMPQSAVTALFDPDVLPDQVCSNVDGSIFQFHAACALHSYEVVRDDNAGCGNYHDCEWKLHIVPGTTQSLRTADYPFLACPWLNAIEYGFWSFSVGGSSKGLSMNATEKGDDCEPDLAGAPYWTELFDELMTVFTTCDAKYAW